MVFGGTIQMKCSAIISFFLIARVGALVVHHRQDVQASSRENATFTNLIAEVRPSCANLINMGSHFTVEVGVGTPPQMFELVADTGSNAVIVQSCVCQNVTPECKKSEDCFIGTNKSSSFVAPTKNDSVRILSFGSGDIAAYAATDVVQLGQAQATLKDGLLLMVNRALMISSHFEGILGLGIPSWVQEAKTPPKMKGANPENQKRMLEQLKVMNEEYENNAKREGVKIPPRLPPAPRLLEEAGVDKFSICMNDGGTEGVLRLQPPESPNMGMLAQIGKSHWTLDLQGFSAGSASAPIKVCDKASKSADQDAACNAVPDSGTTQIMGPQDKVEELFAEVCDRWPRCKAHSGGLPGPPLLPDAPGSAELEKHMGAQNVSQRKNSFLKLIGSCNDWIKEGDGVKEVPSIFVHLGGAEGETQILELTSWAYIVERKDVTTGEVFCEPLFGVWDMPTPLHGPVWIFGTPLFFEYQVFYSTGSPTVPASLGFSTAECGSCVGDQVKSNSTKMLIGSHRGDSAARRIPRRMSGKPRMPSFGPKDSP